jgi:hypothetical protein
LREGGLSTKEMNSTLPHSTAVDELAATIQAGNVQPNIALPNLARDTHNQKHYVRPN